MFPGAKALLDWAVEQTEVITLPMVSDRFGKSMTDEIENLEVLMEQLTTVLGQLKELKPMTSAS